MSVRVGVIGPCDEDDFAFNIADGFNEIGVQATLIGSQYPSFGGGRTRALMSLASMDRRIGGLLERSIIGRALEGNYDAIISVVSLNPEIVRALAESGTKVALWFPDHVTNLGQLRMFDAPYNGLFFKEPWLVRRLNSLIELPVHYLPEACNPRIHRPTGGGSAVAKVVVVGNLHAIRARLLERLVRDGVPIEIYGNPRDAGRHASLAPFHTGRYVRGLEKAAVFHSAAAVLNNLHPGEIEGINCRLFEATACGGAVVSEYREELPRFFRQGSEVFTFSDYEELLGQLRTLVEEPDTAIAVRSAASRRSLSDHTYAQRLGELLEHIL
jgi:spore maturation protein CgeB